MSDFTAREKLAVAEREVARRRRVYPNRVETGRMKQRAADYELAVMEAIRDDIAGRAEEEERAWRLDL